MSDGDDPSKPDWGNVRFGRRPSGGYSERDDRASARFAIGLSTFVIVALLYPWYSYWVQSRLLAADVAGALEQLTQESDAESARMQAQAKATNARLRERQWKQRLARVAVRGFSESNGATIAIVDLGDVGLLEAKPVICAKLQRLRGSGSYGNVHVQKFRGSSPALSVGTINCAR